MTGYRDFITQEASAVVLRLSFICCRTIPQVTLENSTLWPAEWGKAKAFNNNNKNNNNDMMIMMMMLPGIPLILQW